MDAAVRRARQPNACSSWQTQRRANAHGDIPKTGMRERAPARTSMSSSPGSMGVFAVMTASSAGVLALRMVALSRPLRYTRKVGSERPLNSSSICKRKRAPSACGRVGSSPREWERAGVNGSAHGTQPCPCAPRMPACALVRTQARAPCTHEHARTHAHTSSPSLHHTHLHTAYRFWLGAVAPCGHEYTHAPHWPADSHLDAVGEGRDKGERAVLEICNEPPEQR